MSINLSVVDSRDKARDFHLKAEAVEQCKLLSGIVSCGTSDVTVRDVNCTELPLLKDLLESERPLEVNETNPACPATNSVAAVSLMPGHPYSVRPADRAVYDRIAALDTPRLVLLIAIATYVGADGVTTMAAAIHQGRVSVALTRKEKLHESYPFGYVETNRTIVPAPYTNWVHPSDASETSDNQ